MEKDLPRDILEFHEGDMPFSTQFGDHFYCKSDGRAECVHVFLGGNDLPARWHGQNNFTIAELGFGTGLNFLETWRQWKQRRTQSGHLHFISFEAYPMPLDAMLRGVAAWPQIATEQAALAKHWHRLSLEPATWSMDEQTMLTVIVADALEGVRNWKSIADAWFLDGFAPARNPDMWSLDLMREIYARTADNGTFASYTAAGWVRRNLSAAGFEVAKVPGFAGKRDMIKGVKRAVQPQDNRE